MQNVFRPIFSAIFFIQIGRKMSTTRHFEATYESIEYNEEIMIPVTWPTVVKNVCIF